jgi:hypothetical protein
MTRRELARFWNEQIDCWFREEPFAVELREWERSVGGKFVEAEDWAFPDPFTGDLLGSPRLVILATNPGVAIRGLQCRDGVFAQEIKEIGYTRWASKWRYEGEDSPVVVKGRRGFQFNRLRRKFARRFLHDDSIEFRHLLTFELYPFHSRSLAGGSIEVQPHTMQKFLLEPLSELGRQVPVLAIGSAAWSKALDRAKDLVEDRQDIKGFRVKPGRTGPVRWAVLYHFRGGARILVEWHLGGNTPPADEHDIELLRRTWFGS